MNVAGFAITDSELTRRLAQRTRSSFLFFHPDIPFHVFGLGDEEKLLGEKLDSGPFLPSVSIRPRFALHLLQTYDAVIYLDVDTIVVSPLDEFLSGGYDVAGSLNVERYPGEIYLNCGVFAVTNRMFCQEWTRRVYESANSFRDVQEAFNDLVKSGRYSVQIVDEKDCYYNERSRPYWDDIVIRDGRLFCNNRQLKVLHWAGGFAKLGSKFSYGGFSPEVRQFLDRVGNTTDFTSPEFVANWRLFP